MGLEFAVLTEVLAEFAQGVLECPLASQALSFVCKLNTEFQAAKLDKGKTECLHIA